MDSLEKSGDEEISDKYQNGLLTKMIIYLHEHGYTEDFCFSDRLNVISPLSDPAMIIPHFEILLINQVYDELTHSHKYIHAIASDCGMRGLLLADKCLLLSMSSWKVPRPLPFDFIN
ncbi:hypothetical protein [Mucilaginibacter celer]|uniref:hypothetical protein n=1 Tax=Mucilaginibacter celer TaxID=2305508 RepID=UPI0013CECB83|nr:hypothetical protein [Mucilaginibacter celer]